jgi:hypothetical protein
MGEFGPAIRHCLPEQVPTSTNKATPALEQVVQAHGDALQQKCELIISRSYWHIGLIFTLALILSTPALYVLRKPSEPAGLELIAAVIGLGAIRCYLLGTRSSIGDLQLADFYFAIVVGWVALIPLCRYDKGHDA